MEHNHLETDHLKTDQLITILDRLERTEAEYGDRLAVDDGATALTYSELAGAARGIGSILSEKVAPNEPVAIFAEKSTATLTCMYGVVYAGGFYVSVNPEQPPERVRKILDVLESRTVVVDEARREQLAASGYSGCVLYLEDLYRDAAAASAGAAEKLAGIREQMTGEYPLYGVFTSGSTGNPKGIVVQHRSVIDFIGHFTEIFGITCEDIIGNQAPFDFDVSVKDLYSAMFTGAEVVLIPREFFSTPPRLLDYLCDKNVTVLIWAVSALCIVSGLKGLRYRVPDKVRMIMFSGEVMPIKHLQIWQAALPDAQYVNLYGPSEITCNCTYYRINRTFEKTDKLPIGGAFPGRTVFLMDEEGRIVTEPGVSGEICCAGESLAIGYYNNPEQTARQFIMFDLNGVEQRVYKTGDLAAYGTDGELYFAGRGDFQIKHMGHRIELEEIETNFTALDGVARAVCLFDEPKNRIVCWYMGDIDPKEVRIRLKEKVPAYMVPGRINRVEEMPYNKNGKIDRAYFRALLAK